MIADNWSLFYLILCFLFNKCFCYFSCLLLTWFNFNFKTPLPEPHVDFSMFNFNLIPKLPIISYLQSILSHQYFHFSIPVLSSGFKIQFPSSWSASFSSPLDEGMLAATLWISENTLILNDSSSAYWIHVLSQPQRYYSIIFWHLLLMKRSLKSVLY